MKFKSLPKQGKHIAIISKEIIKKHLWIPHIRIQSENESCSVLFDSLRPHGLYSLWNSSAQNTGLDSLSLLQWIFPTQESNHGLLHCRWILYQLSYQGSPYESKGVF